MTDPSRSDLHFQISLRTIYRYTKIILIIINGIELFALNLDQ